MLEAQGGILSVSEQASIDPSFLSDAVNNGSMPPFHILSSIFTSFGGMSFIDLPTELMSNAVARRALGTSREMVSEQVIADFTERIHVKWYLQDNYRILNNKAIWTGETLSTGQRCISLEICRLGGSLRARQTIKHKDHFHWS